MTLLWTDPEIRPDDLLFRGVVSESQRQVSKWGIQTHTPAEWFLILGEEFGELGQELCRAHFDNETRMNLYKEALQVATLALKIAAMSLQTYTPPPTREMEEEKRE